jgi:hypothetical protein
VLLVICGAGASFDAFPAVPRDVGPPLAADLFAERPDFLQVLQEWPAARSVVQRMRKRDTDGGTVEQALSQFMSRLSETGDPVYKRDVIALRFYLREVVLRSAGAAADRAAHLSNYLELVTRLHDARPRQVAFVSFNYDTLLEEAIAARFGCGFHTLQDYLSAPMRVFKPHGSVNWVESIPATGPPPPGRGYFYMHQSLADVADLADFDAPSGGIAVLDRHSLGHGRPDFAVPAVAVPVADKDAFVMPDEHLAALVDLLPTVTHVLTIGWRGTEARFQELCAEHLRPYDAPLRGLVVTKGINEEAGDEVIRNLKPNLHPRTTAVAYDGFTSFLGTGQLEGFASQ